MAEERQMYWCHVCDISVSLFPPPPSSSSSSSSSSTSSLLCPHCSRDFLEEMESSPLLNSSNPSPSSGTDPSLSHLVSLLDPSFPLLSAPPQTLINSSNDNHVIDSPFLRRLIQHLTDSDPEDSSPSDRNQSPASKSAVESIPTVKISTELLELDSVIMCAVCKDQFSIGDEAKQLACKHMYHSDCILPWLSQHNSCPVCRFQLPTENDEVKEKRRRRFQGMSLDELMMDEDELFGIGNSLRYIARRNMLMSPDWSRDEMMPPQQGEEEEIIVWTGDDAMPPPQGGEEEIIVWAGDGVPPPPPPPPPQVGEEEIIDWSRGDVLLPIPQHAEDEEAGDMDDGTNNGDTVSIWPLECVRGTGTFNDGDEDDDDDDAIMI